MAYDEITVRQALDVIVNVVRNSCAEKAAQTPTPVTDYRAGLREAVRDMRAGLDADVDTCRHASAGDAAPGFAEENKQAQHQTSTVTRIRELEYEVKELHDRLDARANDHRDLAMKHLALQAQVRLMVGLATEVDRAQAAHNDGLRELAKMV